MTGDPTAADAAWCTCGGFPDRETGNVQHSITCMTVAVTQPHAMVDPTGAVYYPDNRDDAIHFYRAYEAVPVTLAGFPFGDVTVQLPDDPTPTTGGPVDWAPGCCCYLRYDAEYGDLLTAPPGGCPVHSCTCLDNALGRGHSATCIHTSLNAGATGNVPWLAAAVQDAREAWDRYRLTPFEVILPDWYWQLPNSPEPPHTAMGVRYVRADGGPTP